MPFSTVASQFNKLFEFQKDRDWILPEHIYTAPHFEVPELQHMKRELNSVKGKLTQFDLDNWSLHTQYRDAAGFIIGQLRRRIKPELPTLAWCKFYEIISRFPLAIGDRNDDPIRSLHLCEAPGAFICAFNHYLVLHYPEIDWQWFGNTFNPYYEGNPSTQMIPDDRLIKHTWSNWLFGADLTGNLLHYYNHVDIVNKATTKGKMNLVTADGSIDCMSDPGEQERLVEFLHYCETMTALAVLAPGGTFVLKIFTTFEKSTVCLLYLLNCLFDKTLIFKPVTSKSGNSELYLVCLGYNERILSTSAWEKLIFPYKNGSFEQNKSMFSINDIPASFLAQLTKSGSDFFLENQIKTINENVYYFLNPYELDDSRLNRHKISIARHYIEKYQLVPIPKTFRIVPQANLQFAKHDSLSLHTVDRLYAEYFAGMLDSISVYIGKRIDVLYTTKFAAIENVQNLCHYLTKNQTKSSLYNLVLQVVEQTTVVINVSSFNLEVYSHFQKDLFNALNIALAEGKHVLLINVPFHTHFLAGLWCIVGSAFEVVYFKPGWCLFYKNIPSKLNSVRDIFSKIENVWVTLTCSDNNQAFARDIIALFDANVLSNNFIPSILNVCNDFQIPPILGNKMQ